MADFFAPQSPIFISHAWGDGTAKFVGHLKEAIEDQTLVNVWVDMLGIDQVVPLVCCAVCARRLTLLLRTVSVALEFSIDITRFCFFDARTERGRCRAAVQGCAVRCQRHHRVPDADVPHAAQLPARAALGA